MLRAKNLSIKYPDKMISALINVNFELPQGAICLLSGDYSSGQTTLCLAIGGLIKHAKPDAIISGVIEWKGTYIDPDKFHPEIAITLENPYSQFSGIKYSVIEEIAFGLEMRGLSYCEMNKRIGFVAEALDISHLLQRNLRTLSGGETQKIVLACSYVLKPDLWILDRPLTELDPLSRINFLENLKHASEQNGATIVIAEEPAADLFSIATHLLNIKEKSTEISLNTCRQGIISESSTFPSKMQLTKTLSDSHKKNSFIPTLEVDHLGFHYTPNQPLIFDDLSFSVNQGECLWITGPNGCGKTTLAKIIAGILKPKKGRIILHGKNVLTEPLWKVARHVSYAFQNPDLQIFSTNVWDEVLFGPMALGFSKERCAELAEDALKLFGLNDKKKIHPHDLTRSDRKRLGLASAFAMNTPVIILDEPTQFQNSEEKRLIKEAINESLSNGKSILCITHDLTFII